MGHRERQKQCDRCQGQASILYRIQCALSDPWQLVCRDCWSQIQTQYPDYHYGGTWKAKKRH
jgi:hypothetical protein